jgi:hypothetical protein
MHYYPPKLKFRVIWPKIIVCFYSSTLLFDYSSSTLLSLIDPGSELAISQQSPSKTIGPPIQPEGNAANWVYCVVSPVITPWVDAILRCLQPGNEWISLVV